MPIRTVDLTDYLDRFVQANIEAGRYQDAGEVVREALRLLEQRQREDELRLDRLREAVQAGEDAFERGDYVELEVDEVGEFLAALSAAGRKQEP
jgi:antitoxin ParD1/3/4